MTTAEAAMEETLRRKLAFVVGQDPNPPDLQLEWLVAIAMQAYHQGALDALKRREP